MERALVADYFATADELVARLDPGNHALALEIASLPEQIRGYGHVKEAHLARALAQREALLVRWRAPEAQRIAA